MSRGRKNSPITLDSNLVAPLVRLCMRETQCACSESELPSLIVAMAAPLALATGRDDFRFRGKTGSPQRHRLSREP